jgi:hypothetical protein
LDEVGIAKLARGLENRSKLVAHTESNAAKDRELSERLIILKVLIGISPRTIAKVN